MSSVKTDEENLWAAAMAEQSAVSPTPVETCPSEGKELNSVSDTETASTSSCDIEVSSEAADRMLNRVGQMTRKLREGLLELGLDRKVGEAAQAIPDARDRLRYVITMTEQAAERAMNAIDRAKPIQAELSSQALALDSRWQNWFNSPDTPPDVKALVKDTRDFLQDVPKKAHATDVELIEILLAQDFQDLTGQVIKKIMAIVQNIENELITALIETIPADRRKGLSPEQEDSLLNGPQIHPEGRTDVVTDQSQVDDLLASLGF
jgi:chemotaxis protein CheZ